MKTRIAKYQNESTEKLNSLLKMKTIEVLDKTAIRKILKDRKAGESAAKKATKAPAKKVPAKKKEKGPKKPGVIVSILNAITDTKKKDGVSQADILKVLVKLFPDKAETSMSNTIRAQIGTKKSPCRMEKERSVSFTIVTKKEVRYFSIKK